MQADHQIEETILIPKKQNRLRRRDQIHLAWGWCCCYCGKMLTDRDATLDHIVAKANGGATERRNLASCCFSCNAAKQAQPWREWFRAQPFWTECRERWIEHWLEQ